MATAEATQAIERRTIAKVSWRLLPLIALAYCIAYIDRSNISFAALTMAFSATLENEGTAFATFFRFVLIPMTLFAGTFFPVSQLPAWLRPLTWVTPLWHGTELARGAALGTMGLWPALGHIAYLVAMLAAGVWLSRWRFVKRLGR